MTNQTRLTAAIDEFLIAKQAEGLSHRTIEDYTDTFNKARQFFDDDPYIQDLEPKHIHLFLNDYNHLKKKTRRNMCVALSSLYQYYLMIHVVDCNIMRLFRWPKPDILTPDPLDNDEIARIFDSITRIRWWHPTFKNYYYSPARNCHRNRAMSLLFLDTGMRSGELCGLSIKNYNPNFVKVFGKGSKERNLPISELTNQAIQIYWEKERKETPKDGTVFITERGNPLTPDSTYRVFHRIGIRADIHLYPHRFRHTFAITFLRNGAHIYALQNILGHTSLEMVKRYLKIAESDVSESHRKASPVRNLNFDPFSPEI